jgi:hypothetical protein
LSGWQQIKNPNKAITISTMRERKMKVVILLDHPVSKKEKRKENNR